MSILDETSNIIRLYRHCAGKSEIPDEYHLWSVISLIAASVADRVHCQKFAESKLFPNLYVMLIGASGGGKDHAVEIVLKLILDNPRINSYYGKTTAAHFIDFMAHKHKRREGAKLVVEDSKVFFVTPETSWSLGSGHLAEDMVKLLTGLYKGGEFPVREGTRLHGSLEFRNNCINWLAGTTKVWLMKTLTRDDIEGGPLARVVAVNSDYDPNVRMWWPEYPADREEVMKELRSRINELCYITGEFEIEHDAKKIDEQWYMTREMPDDDSMLPSWKRQHDLVLKLSMILSLADDISLVIRSNHVKRAQVLAHEVHKKLPDLISFASVTPETKGLEQVRRMIQRYQRIPRYILMQRLSNRGIDKRKLDDAIELLVQSKQVIRKPSPSGAGLIYEWNDVKRRLPSGD